MLSMGLGINQYNGNLKSKLKLVRQAGGVLYLDARMADGNGKLTGNDSPFVDLSGNVNDGTLNNFAGTGASGWQDTPSLLRFDGSDDFVGFVDKASLDITTAPLALACTIKIPIDSTGYILAKNDTDINTSVQYGILHRSGRLISMYNKGLDFAQFVINSDKYVNVVFLWDGLSVKSYQNGSFKSQDALDVPLVSNGTLKLGKRVEGGYLQGDVATITIYTGSDINKILKAEARISAEYLALNP